MQRSLVTSKVLLSCGSAVATVAILAAVVMSATPQAADTSPMTWPLGTEGNLVNMRLGDRLTFSAVDSEGNTWETWFIVSGVSVIPSTGKWYWVMEQISNREPAPSGPEGEFRHMRSTPDELIAYFGLGREDVVSRDAPVGTTWTWGPDLDGDIVETMVEAVGETVTVPAGTFTDCIRFHKRIVNSPKPDDVWTEWVKPGFFMVKVEDYAVEHNAPVIYELTDYTRSGN